MLDPESRMKLTAFSLLVLLSAGSPAALGAAGQAVPNAFVPSQLPVDLLPVPKQVLWGSGEFSITPSTRIVVGNSATDEDLFAARELNEELRARYGVELDVVRERDVGDPTGQIVMGEPASTALLDRLLRQAKITLTAASPGPEGYVLQVSGRQILVAG